MKIAINTIYKDYDRDKLFLGDSCKIGENLLLPTIMFKQKMESLGHEVHTWDMYNLKDVDAVIFQELPDGSLLSVSSLRDLAKYILKGLWRDDRFLKTVLKIPKKNRVLLILEPPVVAPKSYNPRWHKYFSRVLTWDDKLAQKVNYQKIFCPQCLPEEKYFVDFKNKKQFTLIASNKESTHISELYSARKKVIKYFEDKPDEFDLYGFGWQKENFKNYKGTVDGKLRKLSEYKYCICFENMKDVDGYITEKIFDCFFAGCVPIYWGASNITEYVPDNTFIDMRKFSSIEEMHKYVSAISQEEYERYLNNIRQYLMSSQFGECFSVERYVNILTDSILN